MMAPKPKNFPPPPDAILTGTRLVSRIAFGIPKRVGTISDGDGRIRWHYGPHSTRESWGSGNPLRKPDFVLFEEGQTEAVRVRRISFLPSVFTVIEQKKIIGTVKLVSLLRNKYFIEINEVNSWTFHMPLYRAYFYGKSAARPEFWVVMGPSEMQWNILLMPGLPERSLAATLAFIHNERCFYS